MTSLKLSNGVFMPFVGLGTGGKRSSDEETEFSIRTALDLGYRHIDTAFMYGTEEIVGRVIGEYIREGKLKREEIFVTTKLPPTANESSEVEKCARIQLHNLQLDYFDLFLVHTPCSIKRADDTYVFNIYKASEPGSQLYSDDASVNLLNTWLEMEKLYKSGLAKAIGVSNFNEEQLSRILSKASVVPHVNQIEVHLHWPQKKLVDFCQSKGIAITAYGPLGCPGKKHAVAGWPEKVDIDDPLVIELAEKYHKTPAQILLRQLIQREIVVVPKSTNQKRLCENFGVFDFVLSEEDLQLLDSVPERKRLYVWNKQKHPEYPFKEQLGV